MDTNQGFDGFMDIYEVSGESGSVGRRRVALATSVQQAVAYGKFLPDSYIPQTVLLEAIYEHHKDTYSYSNRLLSAVSWEGRQYCVSAAGTDRRRVRLTRLGKGDGEGASCVVKQHHRAIEGVFCNVDDGLQGSETRRPIFAVKSADSVDFLRLYDGDGHSQPFALNQLGPGFTCRTNRLEDYSWNQYMSRNGVAVTASGGVHECDCDHDHSLTLLQVGASTYDADMHSLGVVRCECSALHPSLALTAMHHALIRVDFREKLSTAETLYRFSQGNFITAFAVSKRQVCTNEYSFAASTATHVHLFDMRKAIRPMTSWEHYMNSSSTQDRPMIDFCTASPDGLYFSCEGGRDFLVATSSFQGRGILLHWNTAKDTARLAYHSGHFVQHDSRESISACESTFSFQFEPTDVDSVDPIEPPQVAYDRMSYAETAMLQSFWDEEYDIFHADSDTQGHDRVCRLLGNTESGSDRDLGISITDHTWEHGRPTQTPLVYRLTSKGNIIVQTLVSQKMHRVPAEATAEQQQLAALVPISGTSPPMSTKRKADESRVSIESHTYAASRDNRLDAPMHGSLFCASQLAYHAGHERFSDTHVMGVSKERVASFLKQLLESSPGFPISACEAWSILQRYLLHQKQSTDDKQAAHDLECIIPHLDGIKGFLPEKQTSRNTRKNKTIAKENNELSTLLELMQVSSLTLENVHPSQDVQAETSDEIAWPILPPKQFLRIWDSVNYSQHGKILSWKLQSPGLIAERLSHARPASNVQSTAFHMSIVSMKMLTSGDTALSAKVSNSSSMLTKLMDRWDQQERAR
ncbi:hypothetical protein PSENEW3n2_00000791 [Picochlorum sp. SENEW3]|nr:hypothetical protein PSENEW3n2_00000791 [Picochlorum sp. SENEW3]WPT15712.1 hypothetical protein PSENEW3_00000791 [Picochlorum sp. SENEW3]